MFKAHAREVQAMLYADLVFRCRGLAAQVYGQGISVAAIEAETLQGLLQVASTTCSSGIEKRN